MAFARSILVFTAAIASVCVAAIPALPARLWAARVGITADVSAAADLTPTEAAAVLGRLAEAATARSQLSSAETSLTQLRKQRAEAVKSGPSTPESTSSLDEQIAAAELQRNNAETSLFTEITQDLPSSKIALLQNAKVNKRRAFGAEFKIAEWTDEEAVALERAVAREKIVSTTGEQLDEASAQTLAQARGKAGVAAAIASLQARRAELDAVFASAAAIGN